METASISKQVHDALVKSKQTLAIAESCTGGLIAHSLTNYSGSSKYFVTSLVVYSIAAKIDLLDVEKVLIMEKGDVSREVAISLAAGVRNRMLTDLGLGITGIAGPMGATKNYPVGTAFIALAGASKIEVKEVHYEGSRIENKQFFADQALGLLLEYLIN